MLAPITLKNNGDRLRNVDENAVIMAALDGSGAPTPFKANSSGGLATDAAPGILRVASLSNTVDLPNGACRGLHIAEAGDVKFTPDGLTDADAITLTLPAPSAWPYAASRIWATGTTATVFAVY